MEWDYKKHKITVNEDGLFVVKLKTGNKTETRKCNTLQGCKNAIDSITENYYTFTEIDLQNLLGKLTERERDCIIGIIEELKECYYGGCIIRNSDWNWKFFE